MPEPPGEAPPDAPEPVVAVLAPELRAELVAVGVEVVDVELVVEEEPLPPHALSREAVTRSPAARILGLRCNIVRRLEENLW